MEARLSGDLQRALDADPGAPARRAPARRAPRPDRARARRRAGRQPRRRARPPDPGPREPSPGARRRARRPRPRPRPKPTPPCASDPRAADGPHATACAAGRPERRRRPRARPRPRRASGWTARSTPVEAALADRPPRVVRARAAPSRPRTRPSGSRCARLRDHQPEPPRDLWARTAAAHRTRVARPPAAPGAAPRPLVGAPPSLVALGVAVIALVARRERAVRRARPGPDDRRRPPPPARRRRDRLPRPSRGPTPITVGAGSVAWVGTSPDGELAYNVTPVERGLSAERQPDCAPVSDGPVEGRPHATSGRRRSRSRPSATRPSWSGPTPTGDDTVLVIALPTGRADADADPRPSRRRSPRPRARAEPDRGARRRRPTEPSTSAAATRDRPTARPPKPTADADAGRHARASRRRPSATATPEPTRRPDPGAIAIGRRRVVGESAALLGRTGAGSRSPPDRPRLGRPGHLRVARRRPTSRGRDTIDHSVFASWVGGLVVGSRRPPTATADGRAHVVPARSGDRQRHGPERRMWRPIVGPDRRPGRGLGRHRQAGDDGVDLRPRRPDAWSCGPVDRDGGASRPTPQQCWPTARSATSTSAGTRPAAGSPSGSPTDDADDRAAEPAPRSTRPPASSTGPRPPTTSRPRRLLDRRRRLAWATPPGQGGEGSSVQVVACRRRVGGSASVERVES